jgi:hypothetical protein
MRSACCSFVLHRTMLAADATTVNTLHDRYTCVDAELCVMYLNSAATTAWLPMTAPFPLFPITHQSRLPE